MLALSELSRTKYNCFESIVYEEIPDGDLWTKVCVIVDEILVSSNLVRTELLWWIKTSRKSFDLAQLMVGYYAESVEECVKEYNKVFGAEYEAKTMYTVFVNWYLANRFDKNGLDLYGKRNVNG